MNGWISISLIALALSLCAAVYFFSLRPVKAVPPETTAQRLLAFLWMYGTAFLATTIAWGLADALWTGYGLFD